MADKAPPLRCDLAVIGAGPAGLAAASTAAEAGRRVIVVDEGIGSGGQIWRREVAREIPRPARRWTQRLHASGASVFLGASVVSVRRSEDASFVVAVERGDAEFVVVARAVVLATGARERFVPFPGWTLPGVLGIGAAQALLKSGMDVAGRRVVVAGTGPLLLPVAASLAKHGARVVRVAEQASGRTIARFAASLGRRPALLAQAAKYRAAFIGTRYRTGTWIQAARANGDALVATLTNGRRVRDVTCDLLCVAFGLVPNVELARELSCDVHGGFVVVDDEQRTSIDGVFCAGEPTGIGGVDLSLVEGEIAGRAAAGLAPNPRMIRRRARHAKHAARLESTFALRPAIRELPAADTILCRCEDVRCGDIEATWTPRQAKLYTRAGMGPCQGRICGAALQYLLDWPPDSIRPPVQPARVATLLAGAAVADETSKTDSSD